jgi:hypothetical protein
MDDDAKLTPQRYSLGDDGPEPFLQLGPLALSIAHKLSAELEQRHCHKLAAERFQRFPGPASGRMEARCVQPPSRRSNYRGDITVRPSTLPQGPTSGAETPLISGKFEFGPEKTQTPKRLGV